MEMLAKVGNCGFMKAYMGSQIANRIRPSTYPFLRTHTSGGDERSRTYEMKNGTKQKNIFPESEFSSRISKLRKYMTKENLEACVFTSYHNINYFSGFIYCYFGRFYGYIVTQNSCQTVSAGIDGGQPWRRGYGDNVVYTDWHKDNFFHTIKDKLGNIRGPIGLEFDNVSVDNLEKFNTALPNSKKVDIGEATMQMRIMKTPAEVEVIRQGARTADIGGAAGVEAIQSGVPEYEVALHATSAMVREIAEIYPQSDIMDTWTWFSSGINTDGAHNPATTRKVAEGDILSLNCFPMIQGYYTALERTLFLEHVSPDHLKYWNINCEVHRAGLKLIKPGAKCSDIAKELNDIYRKHNCLQYRSFGYGHSFGILSHYYGREAGLEIREDIETVLEPGMVVSMEPMIMVPESQPGAGGYREHDILIVNESGAENITKFPFGPEHNIIHK